MTLIDLIYEIFSRLDKIMISYIVVHSRYEHWIVKKQKKQVTAGNIHSTKSVF